MVGKKGRGGVEIDAFVQQSGMGIDVVSDVSAMSLMIKALGFAGLSGGHCCKERRCRLLIIVVVYYLTNSPVGHGRPAPSRPPSPGVACRPVVSDRMAARIKDAFRLKIILYVHAAPLPTRLFVVSLIAYFLIASLAAQQRTSSAL